MKLPRPLAALPWTLIPLAAIAAEPAPPAVSASALQACAALTTEAARLACYDKLAGRAPTAAAPAAAATPAPKAAAAPTAGAAAPAAASPSGAAGAAARPASPAPASPEAFGLYSAEHPKALAPTKTETLRILDMSHSPKGFLVLQLEGGQLWELHDGDPLLVSGDTVTVHRAALGSFLVTTPSGRSLRAKRLQ